MEAMDTKLYLVKNDLIQVMSRVFLDICSSCSDLSKHQAPVRAGGRSGYTLHREKGIVLIIFAWD